MVVKYVQKRVKISTTFSVSLALVNHSESPFQTKTYLCSCCGAGSAGFLAKHMDLENGIVLLLFLDEKPQ